ncbi:hypothetical protein [Niveispirillum fermenti]|uniref:hypothetical protein n=1 Tax=Niveispirillum fermenti TaxID=1233113 RepID=UPI003A86D7D5
MTKILLLSGLAALLGACAGLWDLTADTLTGTLAILAASAFLLALFVPRLAAIGVIGLAAGVLLAHLMAIPPPGSSMPGLERGLIAAAVATLPSALGALAGILVARTATLLGWWSVPADGTGYRNAARSSVAQCNHGRRYGHNPGPKGIVPSTGLRDRHI